MAWTPVASYNLGYSIPNKQFLFYYALAGQNQVYQLSPSAEEFIALADMFRNNAPIIFNTDGNYFVSKASAAALKKITVAQAAAAPTGA
jgi:hypothetical protein